MAAPVLLLLLLLLLCLEKMLMAAFLSVLTQAVPSRAKLCSAGQRPPVRAWTEGGALCVLSVFF